MALVLMGTAAAGIVAPNRFYTIQIVMVDFAFQHFGWLFSLTTFLLIFICLYLGLSKRGYIMFGGKEAQPTITKWE